MLRKILTSLRAGLILLTLVVLVPAVGLLVYVADQSRANALDEVKSKVLYLTRLAAAEESQIILSTRLFLQQLAQTPEALGETSRSACNGLVAQQIKLYPHYDNIGVIGPDGTRTCSVLLPEQYVDLSDRAYFKRAVETRDFSVGDYQVGASSGNAGVGFGYPVLDAVGRGRGVVFATLNLKWFDTSLARAQLPPEGSLSVVDSHGSMLARFPETEGKIGRQIAQAGLKYMLAHSGGGFYEGIGATGVKSVWGYVPLHQSASGILFVRVSMPIAAAYAGIDREFQRNLLLIAVTALIIMCVALAFGERLVMRPVKRLTEAARRLRAGDLGARTGLRHGEGEFGHLALAFDGMADSLQSEEAALAGLMAQKQESNEKLVAGMGELERLNGEIAQLGRMSHLLQACQSVEEACAAIMQSGEILFPTEVAALYLMRSSRNFLEYKTGWGATGVVAMGISPESCWALRRGHAYRYEHSRDGLPCEHVKAESPAVPYFCVPLIAQGEILGLLHIRFPQQGARTTDARLQLATTFADQAGLALANLKLREVLKQQSIRDPLTGLHNRRFLEESLEREMSRARRSKAPLALIMADVDHFKRFNDTHGHDAGDAVLRSVAQILKSELRGSDIVCRFGGEEFTVILPDAALDAAHAKTDSLRQAIAATVLNHAGQDLGMITMSFGLAMFPEHGNDSAGLLQAADMALYRAKHEGRNQVAISRPGPKVPNEAKLLAAVPGA